MRKIAIVTFMLLFYITLNAQGRKEIKDAGISYQTEWKYDYADGNEIKSKVAEYKYDEQGNIVMEKTYDEKGTLLTYFEYEYDTNGNKTAELTYNSKSKLLKREEFKYEGKLKVEKKTFTPEGKLKSKKIYEFKTF